MPIIDGSSVLALCLNIKADLMTPQELVMDEMGFVEALISDSNTADMSATQFPFNEAEGRAVTAFWLAQQRGVESDVKDVGAGDAAPNFCTPVTAKPLYQQTIAFAESDQVYHQIQISENLMNKYCKGMDKGDMFMRVFRANLSAFVGKITTKLIPQYETLRGTFVGGSATPVSAAAIVSGNPSINNASLRSAIKREARKMEGGSKKPIVVGDNAVSDYAALIDVACCNTVGGLDASKTVADFDFYRDQRVGSVFNTQPNDVLVWLPGSVQLIDWQKNVGDFDTGTEDRYSELKSRQSISTTIEFPVGNTGYRMRADLEIRYQDCTDILKGYTMTIRNYVKLWAAPSTDTFGATDRLYLTNGLMRFRPTVS